MNVTTSSRTLTWTSTSEDRPASCDRPLRQIWYAALPWGEAFATSWAAYCAGLPVTHVEKGKLTRIAWTLRELEHLAALADWSRTGRVPS